MKQTYQITCANCGKTATKKSPKAKYCSKPCNQRAYEKRKGKTPPPFISSTPKKAVWISNVPTQITKQIQDLNGKNVSELDTLKNRRSRLLNEFSRIANSERSNPDTIGIVSAVIGAGVGLKKLNNDDSAFDIFFKMVGIPALFSLAGKNIIAPLFESGDTSKKMIRLEAVKREISAIDERITALQIAAKNLESINSDLDKKYKFKEPTKAIYKGNEYKYQDLPTLEFTDMWMYLIGNPSPTFYMLITGAPGNGKTTCAVNFANYFHKSHGKTLYIPSEQGGLNVAFQDLLKRNNADFDVYVQTRSLKKEDLAATIKKYDLVILDSINHMKLSPDDIEKLRQQCNNTAFVGILQSRKDGDYKGSQDFKHNCDIFIEMKDMIAHQTKSRYAAPAKHLIQ